MSQNALAKGAQIDPAYVNRLERSGKQTIGGHEIVCPPPSRSVALALAAALGLDEPALDHFLFQAGLAPTRDYQAIAADLQRRFESIQLALADWMPLGSSIRSAAGTSAAPTSSDAGGRSNDPRRRDSP